MSAMPRQHDSPLAATDWHADTVTLADEAHLVAWSEDPSLRVHFAASLGRFLEAQRDVEVLRFHGRHIGNLEDFCAQLERLMPGPTLDRRVDGPRGVTNLLRARPTFPGRSAGKWRYYVWHDADVLLAENPDLFARVADAMAGVAAEAEYVSDDMLIIHRAVLVGGPALLDAAATPGGPLASWYDDGLGEPFWQVVTGIDAPDYMAFHIDQLLRD